MVETIVYCGRGTGYYAPLLFGYRLTTPIQFNGKLWPSAEHLYYASRYMYVGASEICLEYAELIRNAPSGEHASFLGVGAVPKKKQDWIDALRVIKLLYQCKGVIPDPDWKYKRRDAMKAANILKYITDKHSQDILLSTKGSGILCNADHYYWGWKDGLGQNEAGRLLMQIREELLQNNQWRL